MLDQAFEALKTYDWGVDPKVLRPIDETINKTHGDAGARKELEARLAAVLATDAPQAAKDAVCRALRTIGTAASVPALAALLTDEKLSHMARYALQTNFSTEASQALLGALPKASASIKTGIASSLGARARAGYKDVRPAQLLEVLYDKDPQVARSGALALGAFGTVDAVSPLIQIVTKHKDASVKAAAGDSLLECAENQLAAGSKGEAKKIFEQLVSLNPSKAVKEAADLGVKACS